MTSTAPDPHPAARTRSLVRLVALGLCANLVFASAAAWFLRQSRAQYEERVRVNTANLAQVCAEHVGGLVRQADYALQLVQRELEPALAAGGRDLDAVDPFLRKAYAAFPALESIRMADARGNVILGTGEVKQHHVNIADRDYFIRLRDEREAGLVIAEPVKSRISGKWVVNLARRLEGPDDSFAGVVFAQFTQQYLVELFRKLNLGPEGLVSLRRDDMTLLARNTDLPGPNQGLGERAVSPELASTVRNAPESGSYFTPAGPDNVPRLVSYHRVAGFPLYVLVGRASADYLAPWRRECVFVTVLLAVLALGTVASAHTVYRRRVSELEAFEALRRHKDELELRVAERTERLVEGARILEEELGERRRVQGELEASLAKVRQLEGILPICAYCKRIRDQKDAWHPLEGYISTHSDASFTHGICPECYARVRAELEQGAGPSGG